MRKYAIRTHLKLTYLVELDMSLKGALPPLFLNGSIYLPASITMIRTHLKLTYYENMMPRVYNQLDCIYTKYRQSVFSLNKNTETKLRYEINQELNIFCHKCSISS